MAGYNTMNRVAKLYKFAFNNSVAANTVTFSGYAGVLASVDDYTITSAGLVHIYFIFPPFWCHSFSLHYFSCPLRRPLLYSMKHCMSCMLSPRANSIAGSVRIFPIFWLPPPMIGSKYLLGIISVVCQFVHISSSIIYSYNSGTYNNQWTVSGNPHLFGYGIIVSQMRNSRLWTTNCSNRVKNCQPLIWFGFWNKSRRAFIIKIVFAHLTCVPIFPR
jgi:hypothetical protein